MLFNTLDFDIELWRALLVGTQLLGIIVGI